MEPFRTWIDLLFPRACAACGGPGAAPICDACRARISVRPAEGCCRVCGKTLVERDDALGTAEPICLGCRTRRPAFDLARYGLSYDEEIFSKAKLIVEGQAMYLAYSVLNHNPTMLLLY